MLGLVGLLLVGMTAWEGQGALLSYGVPAMGFISAAWLMMAQDVHGPALIAGYMAGLVVVRPKWL